ncbi:MAG TPA: hypothetical protein VMT37_10040 [Solirubrobacterales bacterium]|nr:hypothetical protein [Solirubrobacterales bacterium]
MRTLLISLVLLLVVPAVASAATYYASPTGTGTACSQASPCELLEAIEEVTSGGAVVLQPGTYTPPEAVFVNKAIDFGGAPGAAASTVIDLTGGSSGIDVFVNWPTAVAHDFTILGADDKGSLQLVQGTAERVVSVRTGSTSSACEISPQGGTVPILRDSVCRVQASGAGVPAVALSITCCVTTGSAILRNDDFVSSGPEGVGLLAAEHEAGTQLTVEAVNVIARGPGKDVEAKASGGGEAGVSLSNSSFESVRSIGGALISPSNAAGNQTAAPLFVDAAAGDFREAAGSPTIAAGLTDPLNGALDLAGQPRTQDGCHGTATDIGAYELIVPVPPCVPPAPSSNLFKVKRIQLRPKTGTAVISVAVPGAGQFTLWGKGVRPVTSASQGAEILEFRVVPRPRVYRRLARLGKLQITLKLRFLPTGGSPRQTKRNVALSLRTASGTGPHAL